MYDTLHIRESQMAAKKLNKKCSINKCARKHAAHGYCLMHYKRVQRHGSPEYRHGGKIIGRPCQHCERVATAREMCDRHYQMWRKYGDALHEDKRKNGLPPGVSKHREKYIAVTDNAGNFKATVPQTDASITKLDRPHATAKKAQGLRRGTSRKWLLHRKITGALKGQIVHHIDLDPGNNNIGNLHVFNSAKEHGVAHRSLDVVSADLVRYGAVIFDAELGVYRLSESFLRASALHLQP